MNKLLLLAALAATAYATVDECTITWEAADEASDYDFTADVTLDEEEYCYHTFFEAFTISADSADYADAYIYDLEGDDLATCTDESVDADYATVYDSYTLETAETTT